MRNHGGTGTWRIAVLALVMGACGDRVTAPGPAAARAAMAGGALVPNAVKYRDEGRKPATGRSGGAVVTARALLGRDGATTFEVWSGEPGVPSPGALKKLQLRLFSPDGAHEETMNITGLDASATTFTLVGLPRGTAFTIQANVQGASGPRTGVVTVAGAVWRRPDLAVASVAAPPDAWTGMPVAITAVVRELNGDVGARATCVLDVDGMPVDSAVGIWVDGAGTVSCRFTYAFAEPGTYALRVRVADVTPGDDDPANDAASTEIVVVEQRPLAYRATARDDSVSSASMSSLDFTATPTPLPGGGWRFYYSETRFDSGGRLGREQEARLDAWTEEPVGFPEEPLRAVRVAQRTGGTEVHAASWDVLPADAITGTETNRTGCVRRNTTGAVITSLEICTNRGVAMSGTTWRTTIAYLWNAGDVTYWSQSSEWRTCHDPSLCTSSGYSYNVPPTRQLRGTLAPFGPDYAFEAAFTSGGTHFSASPVVPLAWRDVTYASPRSCFTRRDFLPSAPPGHAIGPLTTCSSSSLRLRGMTGAAQAP